VFVNYTALYAAGFFTFSSKTRSMVPT